MEVVFDIEANGLLDTLTEIHCLVVKDIHTGHVLSCTDNGYGYPRIKEGLDILVNAEKRIAHNGIGFDDLALLKLFPSLPLKPEASLDTLLLAKFHYPNMFERDMKSRKIQDKSLWGRHSLEAWGIRLGCHKGSFGKTNDWSTWTPEMQAYCEQDVEVLHKLYTLLASKEVPYDAISLEMRFAQLIRQMEINGAPFDIDAATALSDMISKDVEERIQQITSVIPPWKEVRNYTPKVNNASRGYVKGVPMQIVTYKPFNPMSRMQIVRYLKETHGWKPLAFSDKNNPKVDGDILGALPYPEAKMFADLLERQKILGQLSSGKEGWLNHVRENSEYTKGYVPEGGETRTDVSDGTPTVPHTSIGSIHGRMDTLGARTHRCTHSSPNLGQVPSPRALYGKECRALFRAPRGYKFVGCDASGIELRNLAHYIFPYDGGELCRTILQGDIHTKNQHDAGLPTRDNAKTFIYAFFYGAGDAKLGEIVAPEGSDYERKREGAKLRSKFLSRNPSLGSLLDDIKRAHERNGRIKAIDGRFLLSVSAHSALNTLLQGAGAIIMKRATVILWQDIVANGWQDDVKLILHVHDEYQHLVKDKDDLPRKVGELARQAIIKAGEYYNFRCPLDGEYKIGDNWYDCH